MAAAPDEPGDPQRRSATVDDGAGPRMSPASRRRWPTNASRSRTPPSLVCDSPAVPWGSFRRRPASIPACRKRIAVHGDRGSAVIEQDDVLRWELHTGNAGRSRDPSSGSPRRRAHPADRAIRRRFRTSGHARQLADFVHAIRGNTGAARRWPRRTQSGRSDPRDLRIVTRRGRIWGIEARSRAV